MIRDVLKMGDPRLLEKARAVEAFDTPDLHMLLADMRDTMAHLNGAGLAAPQIGVGLRVVIFGVHRNPRYPDAEEVPDTVLINPVLEPIGDEMSEGWEGCLSVPRMRGLVPRYTQASLPGIRRARPGDRPDGGRLPRRGGAARGRPPGRHSLSDADPRPLEVRLHRGALPGRGHHRGLSARRTHCSAASRSCSSCSTVLGFASASPETTNTSSARSPSVTIFAVCSSTWYWLNTRAMP